MPSVRDGLVAGMKPIEHWITTFRGKAVNDVSINVADHPQVDRDRHAMSPIRVGSL